MYYTNTHLTVSGFGGFGDQMTRYADAMRDSVAKYKYSNGFMPPAPGWTRGPTVGGTGFKIGNQTYEVDQLGPFIVLPNGRIVCNITWVAGKMDSFELCGKTDYASTTLPKARLISSTTQGWLSPPTLF